MSEQFKYYSLDTIESKNARYSVIFGERSNGKTTAVLERILQKWLTEGKQGAYIRRYDEEVKGRKGEQVYSSIADERDLVNKWTEGKWTSIRYRNRAWYLAKYDDELNKYVTQNDPFCYAFAISNSYQLKGGAYPDITTIAFDEFMTRDRYLVNEYILFTNLLSTIILVVN